MHNFRTGWFSTCLPTRSKERLHGTACSFDFPFYASFHFNVRIYCRNRIVDDIFILSLTLFTVLRPVVVQMYKRATVNINKL